MILGVGTDLLRLTRGEALWARFGERALRKLLHPDEAARFDRARAPGAALARAFAAKEAFVKALGTGFIGVGYSEVGALRRPSGAPYLVFSERLAADLRRRGVSASHLSLSDEGGFVLAFCVLEGESAARLGS